MMQKNEASGRLWWKFECKEMAPETETQLKRQTTYNFRMA